MKNSSSDLILGEDSFQSQPLQSHRMKKGLMANDRIEASLCQSLILTITVQIESQMQSTQPWWKHAYFQVIVQGIFFFSPKAAQSSLLPITILPYWQLTRSSLGVIWRLYPEYVSQALLCHAAEQHWGTFTDSTEVVNDILAFRQKFTEWHLSNWCSITAFVTLFIIKSVNQPLGVWKICMTWN